MLPERRRTSPNASVPKRVAPRGPLPYLLGMKDFLYLLDVALFRLINTGLASAALDQLMLFISARLTWAVAGLAFVLYAMVRRRRDLLTFCLTLGLTLGLADFVTYQLLKPAFSRERPCYQLPDVRLVQERCGSDFGFPSNHAANAGATVTALALTTRRWPLVATAAVLAVLVGVSRIYLGVHFPADVFAGFLVGALLAAAVYGLGRGLRRLRSAPAP